MNKLQKVKIKFFSKNQNKLFYKKLKYLFQFMDLKDLRMIVDQ